MILGFKDRFLPFVKDGTKTHTIRAGARWRAGMRVDIFENVRQPKEYKYDCDDDDCDYENKSNWSWKECPVCFGPVTAVQTGGMKLLFRAPVTRVQRIEIAVIPAVGFGGEPDTRLGVEIDGALLDIDETNAFFHRDGFRDMAFVPQNREQVMYPSTNQAFLFWAKQLKAGPFVGQIIHWDYDQRVTK